MQKLKALLCARLLCDISDLHGDKQYIKKQYFSARSLFHWQKDSKANHQYSASMSELRERVRGIALDVVRQVNGENVDSILAGISFELPMRINERDVVVRFRCFLSDLEFEPAGVYDAKGSELTEYENDESITQQVRRLNNLFNNGLRRAGFRSRELL
jgi:hypothetical protein